METTRQKGLDRFNLHEVFLLKLKNIGSAHLELIYIIFLVFEKICEIIILIGHVRITGRIKTGLNDDPRIFCQQVS